MSARASVLWLLFCVSLTAFAFWAIPPASAQRARGERIEMEWGYVDFSNNEMHIVSTVEDPPKIRMSAVFGGNLGNLTFNRRRADGGEEEVAMIQGKLDERERCHPDVMSGEIAVWVRDGRAPGDGMRRVMLLNHDRVWLVGSPEPPGTVPCSAGGYRR